MAASSRCRSAQRAVGNPDEVGAAAYDYLFYSGYVALAYWWARSVAAAEASSHSAGLQGRQARNRTLLLRAHPAAHAARMRGDRERRGAR